MGTYTTRLGCQLSFSEEKEADIITVIQKLNATHKTGQFISNLLRIALENPEILDIQGGTYGPGSVMKSMEQCGISYNRMQFFNQLSKDVSDMKQRIDDIYEMALKTYTLGLMGKHLGIEKKSDNELISTFILERQLKDIQTKLGINISDPIYASNKVPDVHEKAEQILEYIIESYTGIVEELKKQLETPVITVSNMQQVEVQQPIEQSVQQEVIESDTVEENEEDEVIDFGNEQPVEFGSDTEGLKALTEMFGLGGD